MAGKDERVKGTAAVSPDGRYRYRLTRFWGRGPAATFVMLNPSTADAQEDDPTIRRCIGYARGWGCGGLVVVNVYGLRATDPNALWTDLDPVGPDNDLYLRWAASWAQAGGAPLVAAWGTLAEPERVAEVVALPGMNRLQALTTTRDGSPGHPLYLRADAELKPWRPR